MDINFISLQSHPLELFPDATDSAWLPTPTLATTQDVLAAETAFVQKTEAIAAYIPAEPPIGCKSDAPRHGARIPQPLLPLSDEDEEEDFLESEQESGSAMSHLGSLSGFESESDDF